MLTVSVENFGPIREGTVELRPLTVFVGANNSGKSYMAMLLYAISRALALDSTWGARWRRRPGFATIPGSWDRRIRQRVCSTGGYWIA